MKKVFTVTVLLISAHAFSATEWHKKTGQFKKELMESLDISSPQEMQIAGKFVDCVTPAVVKLMNEKDCPEFASDTMQLALVRCNIAKTKLELAVGKIIEICKKFVLSDFK